MPSFPDLPTELLMEIVKYYPELYVGIDARVRGVLSEEYAGNDALRALSQTNHALRGIFLPVLWARFHSCFTARNRPKRKIRTRAKMLERRMKGIQKTPYIQPYIRSLSVSLVECKMDNWQPMAEFLRVLPLLPNLRALSFVTFPSHMVSILAASLKGKVFPTISILSLPDQLAPIIHCFPNVETLNFEHSFWAENVLKAVKGHCERIHTVNNLTLSTEIVELLRDAIPNLRCLSLWTGVRLDTLRLLEGMANLSDVRVRHRSQQYGNPVALQTEELTSTARRILATSKAKGPKEFRLQEFEQSRNGNDDIFIKDVLVFVTGDA
ncbi:hypothetical protein C8R46DRAFT_1119787 [Mycena filopes]|nr:hypothetical protein C8R46DRAFT_1119787 [Mycena filopes]